MPRQARLDAPGTLHHVMGRGLREEEYSGGRRTGRTFFLGSESYARKALLWCMPGRSWRIIFYVESSIRHVMGSPKLCEVDLLLCGILGPFPIFYRT